MKVSNHSSNRILLITTLVINTRIVVISLRSAVIACRESSCDTKGKRIPDRLIARFHGFHTFYGVLVALRLSKANNRKFRIVRLHVVGLSP